MVKYLYSISAKNKRVLITDRDKALNVQYDGLFLQNFYGCFGFEREPTVEEALSLIKHLRPTQEFYEGSIKIEYKRELLKSEY